MLGKIKINRKLFKELDFSLVLILLIICAFGVVNIYSAIGGTIWKKQIAWLVIGFCVMYLILAFDYTVIAGYANIIYWAGVVLLLLNDTIFKSTVNGAGSWMKIGSVTIGQPSEFAKLGMIIMISKKLDEMEGNINNLRNFLILAMYALIPMALIVIQPDMGMTMIFFFIVLGMFYLSGLDLKVIVGGFLIITVLVVIIWNSPLMYEHWKARLVNFLVGGGDQFQLKQSCIAIGSGGILGKGFLKGTQVAGGFIPESHTDFIFSVVGEEWGFVGAVLLIGLYSIMIYKFIKIAKTSKDILGRSITIGVTSAILFSIFQNMGMTIKIMPITGITLPFMSYGGSSMLSNFIAVALILNIGMRRKKINF